MVKQLVYVSVPTIVLSDSIIGEILQFARKRNRSKGIGGFLAFTGELFIQLIEGPHDVIDELYEKIGDDPRHYGLQIVYENEDATRQFSDWPMAFLSIASRDNSTVDGTVKRSAQSPLSKALLKDPENLKKLIAQSLLDITESNEATSHGPYPHIPYPENRQALSA